MRQFSQDVGERWIYSIDVTNDVAISASWSASVASESGTSLGGGYILSGLTLAPTLVQALFEGIVAGDYIVKAVVDLASGQKRFGKALVRVKLAT